MILGVPHELVFEHAGLTGRTHQLGPEGWDFDVLDVVEVAAVDDRLDFCEVTSRVVPQTIWSLGDDAGDMVVD